MKFEVLAFVDGLTDVVTIEAETPDEAEYLALLRDDVRFVADGHATPKNPEEKL